MKRIIILLLIVGMVFSMASCKSHEEINGVDVPYYGLLNKDTQKTNGIQYEVSMRNVVWGIIGMELIVPPVIVIGWKLYKPVKEVDK